MKKTIFLYIFFLSAYAVNNIKAQKFGSALIAGFNASQIDGDRLAGYDKLGFDAGIGVNYDLTDPWQMNIDFLFSQRGSRSGLLPDKYEPLRKITLNYLELPVYIAYKDWLVEEDGIEYYKIQGFSGLSFGRLFGVKNALNDSDIDEENFIKNDLSFLIGAKLYFNRHWGVTGRYTRSLFKMYKHPDDGTKSLLGYFLNFGVVYKLL